MKTAVLSSAHRVGGTPVDCQVEIKENLLDSFVQYRCSVRFFSVTVTQLSTIFMYIDGLAQQGFYTNATSPLFCALGTADWIDTGDVWEVFSEPRNHMRTVTVSNNLLRIRLLHADGTPASIDGDWTLELRFDEL